MRMFKVAFACLAVGLMCLPATAQEGQPPADPGARPPGARGERGPGGMRGPMLTPEKAKAAWEVQAKHVAKGLTLSDDNAAKTVKAYVDARESHRAALEKARQEAMDKARSAAEEGKDNDADARDAARNAGAEMQKVITEALKAEQTKFEASIKKFLTADQATKVMASLGTFNPTWDNMADALIGFNLDSAKNDQALSTVETYVIAVGKVHDSDDREAARTATQEARKQLSDAMKGILSEEQFGKFQRTMVSGRGPGRGGPGGRGGDGAPGAPGDAPPGGRPDMPN